MSVSNNFTKLLLVLDGDTDIVIRRDFIHPLTKVWRGLTEPKLIRLWMAEPNSMIRCEMDLRPGGSFHYEWEEFHFSGSILAVDAPRHMAHVEHFSGDESYRAEVTTDLVSLGTRTRMTQVMRYANVQARAAAIAGGFTDGLDEVYGRLEVLLTTE